MKLLLLNALTLAAEAPAGEEEKFDPSHEFELPAFVPIHIGPLDMSINKAVVYLWLGSLLTMAIGILLMRFRLRVTPDRRQTIGEQIYDVAQTQVAEQGLPTKAFEDLPTDDKRFRDAIANVFRALGPVLMDAMRKSGIDPQKDLQQAGQEKFVMPLIAATTTSASTASRMIMIENTAIRAAAPPTGPISSRAI